MVRLSNAAGFVKTNMPLGQGNTLSDGDALDVAAYFTRQPRRTLPQSRETGRRVASRVMLHTELADRHHVHGGRGRRGPRSAGARRRI